MNENTAPSVLLRGTEGQFNTILDAGSGIFLDYQLVEKEVIDTEK